MTNGELIRKVFNCEVCEPIPEDDIIHVIFSDKNDSAIGFDWSWWNMEYKEPTTKNNLVTLTFSKGTLKYSCKDYVVYKKDWLRDHYGAEIDIMFGDSQYKEPTTKNDLGVLDKISAEIAEYGSIWVEYKITGNSNRDIEKLVGDVLSQAKKQVLDVIDKYKAESEG